VRRAARLDLQQHLDLVDAQPRRDPFVHHVEHVRAQARHGAENPLSAASNVRNVGYDYHRGDVTQTLGVGRFDAVLMILDHAGTQPALWGKSYGYALLGAANATYGPRIALGHFLPVWRVSDQVMAPWIFGRPVASALPSAPGELLLDFGYAGVVLGALALGLAYRLATRWLYRLRGPVEVLVLLSLWILARTLSDESWLMATFAASNLPLAVLLALALGRLRGNGGVEIPPRTWRRHA